MKPRLIIMAVLLVIIVGLAVNLVIRSAYAPAPQALITSFADCASAGYPVAESYPRQCSTPDGRTFSEDVSPKDQQMPQTHEPTLTEPQARAFAEGSSTCMTEGQIGAFETYNPNSGTWWYTLDTTKPKSGCNPACVVDDVSHSSEINWRCTGLIAP